MVPKQARPLLPSTNASGQRLLEVAVDVYVCLSFCASFYRPLSPSALSVSLFVSVLPMEYLHLPSSRSAVSGPSGNAIFGHAPPEPTSKSKSSVSQVGLPNTKVPSLGSYKERYTMVLPVPVHRFGNTDI